jgi:two-component system KDP operon response regulator KdpE
LLRRSRIDDDDDVDDVGLGGGSPMSGQVLVVNDDPDGCELIARLVAAGGWGAQRCTDPGTALATLKGDDGWVAVVLDVRGGTVEALPLLAEIRQQEPPVGELAVLVLTTTADNEVFAWQAGADGYLRRPFHGNDLLADLRAALGRGADERDSHRRSRVSGAQPA